MIYRIFIYLKGIGEDGKFFADIFRAQLTTSELHLLFFDCISDVGKPMQQYAVEFELFDNMPLPSGQGFDAIVKHLDHRAFGKNQKLLSLGDLGVRSDV